MNTLHNSKLNTLVTKLAPVELESYIYIPQHLVMFGFFEGGVTFEPEKDIPDLSGKVIFVTGGII